MGPNMDVSLERRVLGLLVVLLLALSEFLCAQNASAGTPAPPPVNASQPQILSSAMPKTSLEERANTFYQAVMMGTLGKAFECVAPESREDFFHLHPPKVRAFHIEHIEYLPDGNQAVVGVARTVTFPGFPVPIESSKSESWKKIDGEWYVVLPRTDEFDTPFGKMRVRRGTAPPSAEEQDTVRQRIQAAQAVVAKQSNSNEALQAPNREEQKKEPDKTKSSNRGNAQPAGNSSAQP